MLGKFPFVVIQVAWWSLSCGLHRWAPLKPAFVCFHLILQMQPVTEFRRGFLLWTDKESISDKPRELLLWNIFCFEELRTTIGHLTNFCAVDCTWNAKRRKIVIFMIIHFCSHFLSFHEFMSCSETRLTFGSSAAVWIACLLYFCATRPLVPSLTLQACNKKMWPLQTARVFPCILLVDVLPKLGLWLLAFMLVAILEELCGKLSILKYILNHTLDHTVDVAIYQFD